MRPVQKLLRSTRESRSLLRQGPLAHKKNQDHEFDFRRSTISRRPRSISELAGARPAKFVRSRANKFCRACTSKRSEEHTSELQSHSDLVCRLLLEKKKKKRPDRLWGQ